MRVRTYTVELRPKQDDVTFAVIQLYDESDAVIGALAFRRDRVIDHFDGEGDYGEAEYTHVIDLLRNEQPIDFSNGRLQTIKELVGEQET